MLAKHRYSIIEVKKAFILDHIFPKVHNHGTEHLKVICHQLQYGPYIGDDDTCTFEYTAHDLATIPVRVYCSEVRIVQWMMKEQDDDTGRKK